MNKRAYRTHKKVMFSVTGDVSAVDIELLAAREDRAGLESVRKVRRDIALHGTIPPTRLIKQLGL